MKTLAICYRAEPSLSIETFDGMRGATIDMVKLKSCRRAHDGGRIRRFGRSRRVTTQRRDSNAAH